MPQVCYSCTSPPEMRNIYLYLVVHVLVHAVYLLASHPFLDGDRGRSCWPQKRLWFSSSSFHTRRSESNGPQSPTTFCQRRLVMTLLPAVSTLLSGIRRERITCGADLATHTSFSQLHTHEAYSFLLWGCFLSAVCVNACSKPLIWNEAVSKKDRQRWDTRHFHFHYTVTHPLPASLCPTVL